MDQMLRHITNSAAWVAMGGYVAILLGSIATIVQHDISLYPMVPVSMIFGLLPASIVVWMFTSRTTQRRHVYWATPVTWLFGSTAVLGIIMTEYAPQMASWTYGLTLAASLMVILAISARYVMQWREEFFGRNARAEIS